MYLKVIFAEVNIKTIPMYNIKMYIILFTNYKVSILCNFIFIIN